jgi:hypothetical protein
MAAVKGLRVQRGGGVVVGLPVRADEEEELGAAIGVEEVGLDRTADGEAQSVRWREVSETWPFCV